LSHRRREIAADVVHEDDRLIAFLDRGPIRSGRTQIVVGKKSLRR